MEESTQLDIYISNPIINVKSHPIMLNFLPLM